MPQLVSLINLSVTAPLPPGMFSEYQFQLGNGLLRFQPKIADIAVS